MTDEQWQNLHGNYETRWLLQAVDQVDTLRTHLADGEHWQPPQIRTDLLKLHGMAMDVVNNGWDSQLGDMSELALELEEQAFEMMESLEAIYQALSKLIDLLAVDDFDEED